MGCVAIVGWFWAWVALCWLVIFVKFVQFLPKNHGDGRQKLWATNPPLVGYTSPPHIHFLSSGCDRCVCMKSEWCGWVQKCKGSQLMPILCVHDFNVCF